jgi:hypothetical protein
MAPLVDMEDPWDKDETVLYSLSNAVAKWEVK